MIQPFTSTCICWKTIWMLGLHPKVGPAAEVNFIEKLTWGGDGPPSQGFLICCSGLLQGHIGGSGGSPWHASKP